MEDQPRPGAIEPTDEELVRRVRAGDADAVAALFDRHLRTLRVKARAKLPSALRAKVGESDVIQDAYLAAFLRLGEFEDRGDGSFGRWLRQILDHKIVDEVRRHVAAEKRDARREERLPTSGEAVLPASVPPSPGSVVAAAEQDALMREAVEDLPSDYRTAIRLVHEEGLSLIEAGTRMNRSAAAVGKLYARALARLAEQVDARFDGPGDTR